MLFLIITDDFACLKIDIQSVNSGDLLFHLSTYRAQFKSLTDYMIESNTGVLVEDKYEIKKIDSNYFEDEI